jgi:hypothetical protein
MALNVDATWEEWGRYVTIDGRPVSSWEFETIRAECKAKGYRVFPPCDSVKPDGHCAGHEASE